MSRSRSSHNCRIAAASAGSMVSPSGPGKRSSRSSCRFVRATNSSASRCVIVCTGRSGKMVAFVLACWDVFICTADDVSGLRATLQEKRFGGNHFYDADRRQRLDRLGQELKRLRRRITKWDSSIG